MHLGHPRAYGRASIQAATSPLGWGRARTTADLTGPAQHQVPELPDGFWYGAKRRLLGPPLVTEQLNSQRLSKPLAPGVLSCDGLSSAAYSTEEILGSRPA